jgi:hypothetical protein
MTNILDELVLRFAGLISKPQEDFPTLLAKNRAEEWAKKNGKLQLLVPPLEQVLVCSRLFLFLLLLLIFIVLDCCGFGEEAEKCVEESPYRCEALSRFSAC